MLSIGLDLSLPLVNGTIQYVHMLSQPRIMVLTKYEENTYKDSYNNSKLYNNENDKKLHICTGGTWI